MFGTDKSIRNVMDFGAKGDGIANDTNAIQNAIDAGGTVFFPPGIYISGTLYLKSNGGLYLAAGAVLRGSHDKQDYNADDYCPQNRVFRNERMTGAHLISAVEQENIWLAGEGIIDGDSHFWNHEYSKSRPLCNPNPIRPGQMIFLCECRNVKLSGLHLRNSPFWHLFLHGCEDVAISNLRISGDRLLVNNDGIDIDCCRNVTVHGCIIDTGDDGITIRAVDSILKKKRSSENIIVTDCVLSSSIANAIRLGVGNGNIRNCIFSNIIITETRTGISIVSRYSERSPGVFIEDVILNNIMMKVARPFNIKLNNIPELGVLPEKRHIRNITMTNIHAEADRSSNISGFENGTISHLRIKDSDFLMGGHGATPSTDWRGMWGYESTDSFINISRAEDIVMENTNIRWKENSYGWNHDAKIEECKSIRFRNCLLTKGISGDCQQDPC